MKTTTQKQTKKSKILAYFKSHKKVTLKQAAKDLGIKSKNLLDWLWCLERRSHDLVYMLIDGNLSITFI